MKLEILRQTHTAKNPWFIVRSDNKHMARVETMKQILRSIKYRGRSRSLDVAPNTAILVGGDKELRRMKRERKRHGRADRK